MLNKYKFELENFDYNSKYYLPCEHKWCFLADEEKAKTYFKKKEENLMPRFTRVQADKDHPEVTGQWNMLH